jgi:hypothetical protein
VAVTRGMLLTILIVVALLVGVPVLLVCGGCLDIGRRANDPMAEFKAEQEQLTKRAQEFARPQLASFGIRELSDPKISKADPEVFLSGTGKSDDGQLHKVQVRFLIAKFGDTEKWECRIITIDDRIVFNAKNSPP